MSRFVKISRVLRSDHDLTTERDEARKTLRRAQAERNALIDRAEAAEEKISQLRSELDNAEEERERERVKADAAHEAWREADTDRGALLHDRLRLLRENKVAQAEVARLEQQLSAMMDTAKRVIAERDAARSLLGRIVRECACGERPWRCASCGKPATCFGKSRYNPTQFACDDCCGHGQEDGWCVTVDELAAAMGEPK